MSRIKKAFIAVVTTVPLAVALSLSAVPAHAVASHGPTIPCVLKTQVCPPFEG